MDRVDVAAAAVVQAVPLDVYVDQPERHQLAGDHPADGLRTLAEHVPQRPLLRPDQDIVPLGRNVSHQEAVGPIPGIRQLRQE
ncbi:hypothetical protein ACIOJ9_39200 [Streptomyces sp. NPDC088175]|uniref:hypothetical protein n=1 Tax=unclassified Streptomyces TaxID=2593676 RepID=UPI0037F9227F